MTKERIEYMREAVLPFVKKKLLEIDYEGLGKSDAEEFEKDFNEILNMAVKTLDQEIIYKLTESKLKNPKAKTFDILRFVADNAGLSIFEAIEKAYHMGVSEQECILNKIRAEIEQTRKIYLDMNDIDWLNGCDYVLSVIDKYKTESEE